MIYNDLRTFADSYALAAMLLAYFVLVFWAFRPGSKRRNEQAATMIFADESEGTAETGDKNHG
ncbi:cbb3-type cytochrome oxidase subunit 3 [Sphingobium nicotianae]|uniref:Cbb3-type cytochrome c oxidase subunit 3 n=1 Tax=Sphingobium nicotianae TaxID=2782607 RepID=A0A9X1DFR5_9SPHN|nr:cbb3-type cytochrome c oxidase subunit 3 [Sphingobium nicotianae]MBT2189036.1 cbb3-type cytochrome c oxidase subunit 3 [Sphingobium nicotianae]